MFYNDFTKIFTSFRETFEKTPRYSKNGQNRGAGAGQLAYLCSRTPAIKTDEQNKFCSAKTERIRNNETE